LPGSCSSHLLPLDQLRTFLREEANAVFVMISSTFWRADHFFFFLYGFAIFTSPRLYITSVTWSVVFLTWNTVGNQIARHTFLELLCLWAYESCLGRHLHEIYVIRLWSLYKLLEGVLIGYWSSHSMFPYLILEVFFFFFFFFFFFVFTWTFFKECM
jgi:hypothetical protein